MAKLPGEVSLKRKHQSNQQQLPCLRLLQQLVRKHFQSQGHLQCTLKYRAPVHNILFVMSNNKYTLNYDTEINI